MVGRRSLCRYGRCANFVLLGKKRGASIQNKYNNEGIWFLVKYFLRSFFGRGSKVKSTICLHAVQSSSLPTMMVLASMNWFDWLDQEIDWCSFQQEHCYLINRIFNLICKETRLNLIEWSINEVISATAAPGAAGIEQHSNSNCVSDDDQQMEDMRASSLDPAFDFRVHSRIPCVLAHSNVWFSRLGTPWKQTKSGEATLYWKFKMLDHLWESKFYFVTRPLTLSYIPLSLLHTFQTSSSLKQLLLERQHFAQHSLPLRDWI